MEWNKEIVINDTPTRKTWVVSTIYDKAAESGNPEMRFDVFGQWILNAEPDEDYDVVCTNFTKEVATQIRDRLNEFIKFCEEMETK